MDTLNEHIPPITGECDQLEVPGLSIDSGEKIRWSRGEVVGNGMVIDRLVELVDGKEDRVRKVEISMEGFDDTEGGFRPSADSKKMTTKDRVLKYDCGFLNDFGVVWDGEFIKEGYGLIENYEGGEESMFINVDKLITLLGYFGSRHGFDLLNNVNGQLNNTVVNIVLREMRREDIAREIGTLLKNPACWNILVSFMMSRPNFVRETYFDEHSQRGVRISMTDYLADILEKKIEFVGFVGNKDYVNKLVIDILQLKNRDEKNAKLDELLKFGRLCNKVGGLKAKKGYCFCKFCKAALRLFKKDFFSLNSFIKKCYYKVKKGEMAVEELNKLIDKRVVMLKEEKDFNLKGFKSCPLFNEETYKDVWGGILKCGEAYYSLEIEEELEENIEEVVNGKVRIWKFRKNLKVGVRLLGKNGRKIVKSVFLDNIIWVEDLPLHKRVVVNGLKGVKCEKGFVCSQGEVAPVCMCALNELRNKDKIFSVNERDVDSILKYWNRNGHLVLRARSVGVKSRVMKMMTGPPGKYNTSWVVRKLKKRFSEEVNEGRRFESVLLGKTKCRDEKEKVFCDLAKIDIEYKKTLIMWGYEEFGNLDRALLEKKEVEKGVVKLRKDIAEGSVEIGKSQHIIVDGAVYYSEECRCDYVDWKIREAKLVWEKEEEKKRDKDRKKVDKELEDVKKLKDELEDKKMELEDVNKKVKKLEGELVEWKDKYKDVVDSDYIKRRVKEMARDKDFVKSDVAQQLINEKVKVMVDIELEKLKKEKEKFIEEFWDEERVEKDDRVRELKKENEKLKLRLKMMDDKLEDRKKCEKIKELEASIKVIRSKREKEREELVKYKKDKSVSEGMISVLSLKLHELKKVNAKMMDELNRKDRLVERLREKE